MKKENASDYDDKTINDWFESEVEGKLEDNGGWKAYGNLTDMYEKWMAGYETTEQPQIGSKNSSKNVHKGVIDVGGLWRGKSVQRKFNCLL